MREIADFFRTRKKLNLLMVVVNIAVFVVLSVLGDTQDGYFMLEHGAAFTPYILQGEFYRLFTSMFLHFGFYHIFYNMICLLALGDVLESEAGHIRYLVIYLAGGLAGNIFSMYMELRRGDFAVSAGASGAIFSVVGALLWIVIRNRGRLGTITLRSLILMILVTLAQGFVETGTDNAAHVGGFIAGFILGMFLYRKRKPHRREERVSF